MKNRATSPEFSRNSSEAPAVARPSPCGPMRIPNAISQMMTGTRTTPKRISASSDAATAIAITMSLG